MHTVAVHFIVIVIVESLSPRWTSGEGRSERELAWYNFLKIAPF